MNLFREDFLRLAAFAFFERFADADDGGKPRRDGGERPLIYGFVRFAEILAAFAVADNHVPYLKFFQHSR